MSERALKKFSKKEAITFGWKKFTTHWKFLIFVLLVVWVVLTLISNLVQNANDNNAFFGFILQLVFYAVNAVLGIGIVKIMLDITDGKKASWRLLYELYPRALKYFLAAVLYGLMVAVGLILLVIPGIYLAVKYQFFVYFIADKNLGILESFKRSGQITQGHIFNLILFGFICVGIGTIGLIVFGVGLLIAIPVVSIAVAHVYRKLEA